MTIKLYGPGINNYFAVQLVKMYGPFEALDRTCGPMHRAVIAYIHSLSKETK